MQFFLWELNQKKRDENCSRSITGRVKTGKMVLNLPPSSISLSCQIYQSTYSGVNEAVCVCVYMYYAYAWSLFQRLELFFIFHVLLGETTVCIWSAMYAIHALTTKWRLIHSLSFHRLEHILIRVLYHVHFFLAFVSVFFFLLDFVWF